MTAWRISPKITKAAIERDQHAALTNNLGEDRTVRSAAQTFVEHGHHIVAILRL